MIKKFVAFLLSTMFILPTFSYATSSTAITKSANLEQAILKVKTQLNLSDQLTKFMYTEENDAYNFNWEDATGKEFVNVTCALDGDILNYYAGDSGRTYSTVATVDYQQAQKTAQAFLSQVAKEYADKLQLQENKAPSRSSEYVFYYYLVQDGIKLYHQEVEVRVDKQTGQVVSFKGVHFHATSQFEEKTPIVSLEDAQKAYIDKIGLNLNYETYYDDKTEQDQSFLAYYVDNSDCKAISAKTGEVIEGKDKEKMWYDITEDSVLARGDAGAVNQLTEAEQKEVTQREKLLEPEEIVKQLTPFFPVLDTMEMTSTYLSQERQDVYKRQMTLEKKYDAERLEEEAWFSVDAVTGELRSYYYYNYNEETRNIKSGSEVEAKAFIEKLNPVVGQAIRPATETRNYNNENTYYFERLVNGIPVRGDGIEVEYASDQVIGYTKMWTQADFKKPADYLTKEQVIADVGLELVYMQVEEDTYALAYAHDEADFLIDAYTGQKVDYRGEAVTKTETSMYTDIQGHPYEKEITNLYYSGIYLKTDALHPDSAITKGDLKELLNQAKPYDNVKETVDALLKDIPDTQILTKEEGVACLIAVSPYQKIAELTDIFQYPYVVNPVNDKNKGAIALAYGLNWLPDETFNPTSELTKAEAMFYLYNALNDIRG